MATFHRLGSFAGIVFTLVACSSSSSDADLSTDDLDAVTHTLASMAAEASKGGSGSGLATQASTSDGASLHTDDLTIQSSCSPSQLTPPIACAAGGNIYTTLGLHCTGPTGCCGANPACSSDQVAIGGQGTLLYNSCRTTSASGSSISINGSLYDGLTATFTVSCSGVASGKLVYTLSGNLSVRIDGREACQGMTQLTVTAIVDQSVSVSVSGSVCGQHVFTTYDEGCVVTCGNGSCCGGGTRCSTCDDSCVPAGSVDCCNGRYCPPGTQCVSNGTQCSP